MDEQQPNTDQSKEPVVVPAPEAGAGDLGPFARLPKEPQTPIDRPNNGQHTLIIVILLSLIGLAILLGSAVLIWSFVAVSEDIPVGSKLALFSS